MNMKQKNDTELAIEKFERFIESGYANYNLPSSGLINVALNALRAQQERENGCEFCKDNFYRRSLYKFCPYCGYKIDHEPKEAR